MLSEEQIDSSDNFYEKVQLALNSSDDCHTLIVMLNYSVSRSGILLRLLSQRFSLHYFEWRLSSRLTIPDV